MPEATNGDVTVFYETEGDPSGQPLLLVMGLGAQMTAWHPGFRAALVRRGFFMIRFDNRDVGRSTWLDSAGPVDPVAAFEGDVTLGAADPLVDSSGGKATAEAIPAAELKLIPGMGHDLPPAVFDEVADAVTALAQKVTS